MASIILGGGYLAYSQVKKSREKKKARRESYNASRYAALETDKEKYRDQHASAASIKEEEEKLAAGDTGLTHSHRQLEKDGAAGNGQLIPRDDHDKNEEDDREAEVEEEQEWPTTARLKSPSNVNFPSVPASQPRDHIQDEDQEEEEEEEEEQDNWWDGGQSQQVSSEVTGLPDTKDALKRDEAQGKKKKRRSLFRRGKKDKEKKEREAVPELVY